MIIGSCITRSKLQLILAAIVATIVLLFAFTRISHADGYYSEDQNPLSPENVLYSKSIENLPESTSPPQSNGVGEKVRGIGTSIRASHTISEEALRQYLEAKHSPLESEIQQLLNSPYWSTIIGICTIEEYSCSVNPSNSNNLWGLMSNGKIIRFPTLEAGIQAINDFLAKAEIKGRTTIEKLNCWYVQPCSQTWLKTVLRTKDLLESLN